MTTERMGNVCTRQRLDSPGVRVLAQSLTSQSLSFEGGSDSGPYQPHLDFCVILLRSVWLLCNLFYD